MWVDGQQSVLTAASLQWKARQMIGALWSGYWRGDQLPNQSGADDDTLRHPASNGVRSMYMARVGIAWEYADREADLGRVPRRSERAWHGAHGRTELGRRGDRENQPSATPESGGRKQALAAGEGCALCTRRAAARGLSLGCLSLCSAATLEPHTAFCPQNLAAQAYR